MKCSTLIKKKKRRPEFSKIRISETKAHLQRSRDAWLMDFDKPSSYRGSIVIWISWLRPSPCKLYKFPTLHDVTEPLEILSLALQCNTTLIILISVFGKFLFKYLRMLIKINIPIACVYSTWSILILLMQTFLERVFLNFKNDFMKKYVNRSCVFIQRMIFEHLQTSAILLFVYLQDFKSIKEIHNFINVELWSIPEKFNRK